MAPAFGKEAILQGSIDHLCLVCESYLRSEREVCMHVSTPAHRQNLEATDYTEKYRNDRIRKIKKWYFCEFCNVIVSTIKVSLHVEELRHKELKSSQMIGRVDGTIVFEDIAISEEAWHGFINENTCSICNDEFEDKDEHRKTLTHVINLIQSKITHFSNNIYREIDDATFHCLTCNVLVTEIALHINEKKHKSCIKKTFKIKPSIPLKEYRKESFVENCSSQFATADDFIEDEKKNANESNGEVTQISAIKTLRSPQFATEDDVIEDEKKNPNKSNGEVTQISASKTSNEDKPNVMIDGHITEENRNNYIICDVVGNIRCNLCECDIEPREINIHIDGLHHQSMLKTLNRDHKCNTDNSEDEKVSDVLNSIPKFQKENININLKSRTAVCRRCSVNLEFDFKFISNHIEEHKNSILKKASENTPKIFEKDDKPKSSGSLYTNPAFRSLESENKKGVESKPTEKTKQSDDKVLQKMAEEYDLTCIGNKIYCQKCEKNIPRSVKNIKEHGNGELHKNNARLSSKPTHLKDTETKKVNVKKYNLQRVPIHHFVRFLTTIKSTFSEDVVINQKYCINLLAFTFLTMTSPGRLRCQVCELNLLLQDMQDHLKDKKHERALNEVPVIIHTDSEFIREIRSDIFQCGYCTIIDSWEGMENHLKSTSHKESKTFANWRLAQHLPQIEQHFMERQIQNDILMRLMLSQTISTAAN